MKNDNNNINSTDKRELIVKMLGTKEILEKRARMEVDTIIPGVLQRSDGITVLCGTSGIGKTTLMAKLAADLSRGQDTVLGPIREYRPYRVVVFAYDGGFGPFARHLRSFGADLDHVAVVDEAEAQPKLENPLFYELLDSQDLRDRIGGEPDLIIIDSLKSSMQGKPVDGTDVMTALAPLGRWCRQHNTACIVTHHRNKSGGIAGAAEIMDQARNYFCMGRIPGSDNQIYISHEKTNTFITLADTYAYQVDTDPVTRATTYENITDCDADLYRMHDVDFQDLEKLLRAAAEKDAKKAQGWVDGRTQRESAEKQRVCGIITDILLDAFPRKMTREKIYVEAAQANVKRHTYDNTLSELVQKGLVQKVSLGNRQYAYAASAKLMDQCREAEETRKVNEELMNESWETPFDDAEEAV